MANDPNTYKSPVRAIGNVEEEAATNSTDSWSIVALLKGILSRLSGTLTVSSPVGSATAAKQDTGNASLASMDTKLSTIDGHVDGLEGALASILAKIIAAPSTEAKQDAIVTALGLLGTQTTSAAILAKLTSDPATQTTLAAVLAKLIATPSTEAKQDAAITQETAINTVLGTTAGAAVVTSTTGTIQGYLRGIVSLLVSGITVAAHAVTQSGTWTVQPGNTANTTAWKVDGSAVTQPVSLASVPSHAVTNAGTFAVQAAIADAANVTIGAKADAKSTATDTTSISAMSVWKQISASVQSLVTGTLLAAGSAIVGKVGIDQTSGQNLVKQVRSTTTAQSNVAGSASSGTLLASNANRQGACVYNDSTATLYLLLGSTTSSATVHTVQIQASGYYEVPFLYTGQINGIWASATGSARITELT